MTADPLQRFVPGQPLGSLRAATANAWTDAAKKVRAMQLVGQKQVRGTAGPGSLEILIRNDTGGTLAERSVVQVSYPVQIPTIYGVEIQDQPAFSGIVATGTAGTPAVLIEPIRDGQVGRAVIMGVAVVSVDITDVTHTKATLDTGDTAALVSGTSGPATILWREAGTGVKLCGVLLCCTTGIPAVGDASDWEYPPDPTPSGECPDGVTYTTATVSNKTGDCTCLPATLNYGTATYPIGTLYAAWTTNTCPGNVSWELRCESGLFVLYVGGVAATPVSASAAQLVFDTPNLGANCGGAGGTARITITP